MMRHGQGSFCGEGFYEKACASLEPPHEHEGCRLRDIPEGGRARILRIRGCGRMRSRLCAMGFTPGTTVTVCGGGAGCRVQVRDICYVLDCDCAENIVCDPVS